MLNKKILVVPCATQIGVEQFHSLKFNKDFKLIGAAHNESDSLYANYIQLNYSIEKTEFIEEILQIVKKNNIDIILPSHDDVLFILKNIPELESLIPGNDKETINICRFKSKTYKKLKLSSKLYDRVPQYSILRDGFLKPDRGQGSRGSLIINQDYLHCEYLPGDEYTIDCFSNGLSELLYVNPRLRKTVVNGISETTTIVPSKILKLIAKQVNDIFKFKGSWFFQMKKDKKGVLKFLEIAPRIGGGSNINRLNGINLTLSDLYQHLGFNVEVINQKLVVEINRKHPKYNLSFDTIFVDYDDTFIHIKDILKGLNKETIVITRSKVKVNSPYLEIYLEDFEKKSNVIKLLNKPNSVFIDDSFRERKDVFINCKIPCLTPEEANYLI